jgi:phage protein D/phage baseplate assembly protein gpV
MPVTPLLSQFYIKLGGSEAPESFMADLRSVEVDGNLYLPDMCTIELHDPRFQWVDDQSLRIGQELEIEGRASADEQGAATKLFAGHITAIEGDFGERGKPPLLVIRAYDRSHLLHRGTKVRVFRQCTDSDIATRIARERGLQAEVDSTAQVHVHLFQENLTDFEFLAGRARAVGYVFGVEDRKLIFKRPASIRRPVVELDYGTTLLEFRPRLTVASQVREVSVRGWDPGNKREIVGQADSADFQVAQTGWERRGSRIAAQAFGDSGAGELLVTRQPVATQAEGDALAGSLLSELWGGDVHAEGEAVGNPRIQPGGRLQIGGLGNKFSGEYFVTSVRHRFDAEGHFLSNFAITGFSAGTTADLLLEGAEQGKPGTGRIAHGLAVGIVTNNRDPEDQGRVKVRFPWLADDTETDWARVATPMAGAGRGFLFLPEVNDEVLVAFEHGDLNYPCVIGALWNGRDAPPLASSEAVGGDGAVNKRVIKTRAGHTITLDDTSGAEKIQVVDKTGRNSIVIDSAGNKLTVEIAGDVELNARNAIRVTGMNVTVEGRTKLELKAPQVEITGSGRVKVTGGTVELN